jgi:putative transposase
MNSNILSTCSSRTTTASTRRPGSGSRWRAFGCARVVFNDALAAREAAHQAGEPYLTDGELSARLTASKATPGRAWLNEVSAVVLQQALADLNTAYRNFFASLHGTRKGPKMGKPRFRSRKDHRQAVRFTANARFKVLGNGKPAAAEDRRRAGPVVPAAAIRAVLGHCHQGRGRALFRLIPGGDQAPCLARDGVRDRH